MTFQAFASSDNGINRIASCPAGTTLRVWSLYYHVSKDQTPVCVMFTQPQVTTYPLGWGPSQPLPMDFQFTAMSAIGAKPYFSAVNGAVSIQITGIGAIDGYIIYDYS